MAVASSIGWDFPERRYLSSLAKKLHSGNHYSRVVVPNAGTFVVPSLFREAGWDAQSIKASSASIVSAAIGIAITDQAIEELDMRVDGQRPKWTSDSVQNAALVLYLVKLVELEKRADRSRYQQMVTDMLVRKEDHLNDLAATLMKHRERLQGMSFAVESSCESLSWETDQSDAVFVWRREKEVTDERITWDHPDNDDDQTLPMSELVEPLVIGLNHAESVHDSDRVVHVRSVAPDQKVYLWSNLPKVVREHCPLSAVSQVVNKIDCLPGAVIGFRDDLSKRFEVEVGAVERRHAQYYLDLWSDDQKAYSTNVLMTINGAIAGVAGYNYAKMAQATDTTAKEVVLSSVAAAPHHQFNLKRLVVVMATNLSTLRLVAPANIWSRVQSIRAFDETSLPVSSYLNGVLNLDHCDETHNRTLVYVGDVKDETTIQAVRRWYEGE